MMQMLKARSPAKLILSGEHAVVHGCPAIAVAVDRYAESSISTQLLSSHLPTIFFNFLNLDYAKSFTLQALTLVKHRLQEQYYAFLNGNCNIREVLKMPFELLQFAVSNLLENLNVAIPHDLEIHTTSNIPMGCGMGSSAASVMSILYALAHFLKVEIDPNRFLTLGREAENLQHGRSSGLDIQLALHGGWIKFKDGMAEKKSHPVLPFTIVQTGQPESTTGQCVTAVAKHFQKAPHLPVQNCIPSIQTSSQSNSIHQDFTDIVEAMEMAVMVQNQAELIHCIRENHRLLSHIGVVPEKVQAFIAEIENRQGAAKICGAGSVQGDKAGIVWVVVEQEINDLLQKYGYQMQTIQGGCHGTHLV